MKVFNFAFIGWTLWCVVSLARIPLSDGFWLERIYTKFHRQPERNGAAVVTRSLGAIACCDGCGSATGSCRCAGTA